jgi:hypothetical protein
MGAMGMNLTTGQALPPMTGFDANAVAQALAQSGVGNNAQSGVRPGVPAGAMQNPLAQMLAGQRETYQPSDTTWGIKGDRLLRYTPQEGNQRGGGTGGTGAPPGGREIRGGGFGGGGGGCQRSMPAKTAWPTCCVLA